MCKVKIKPVYNFQSVEIELEVETIEEVAPLIEDYYSSVLEALMNATDEVLAPQQQGAKPPKQERKESKPKFEPPTEKQIEIMLNFGIDFDENTTKEQASKMIAASYQKIK